MVKNETPTSFVNFEYNITLHMCSDYDINHKWCVSARKPQGTTGRAFLDQSAREKANRRE